MVLTNDEGDRILSGKEQVYSMDDIVSKLGLSKSTLERWRRNGVTHPQSTITKNNLFSDISKRKNIQSLIGQGFGYEDEDDINTFPAPDFYLGRSPRWKHSTIRQWMINNSK